MQTREFFYLNNIFVESMGDYQDMRYVKKG
jgi:hypothetical protein